MKIQNYSNKHMNNRIIKFRAWGECPTEMGYEMKMIYNPTINELGFNETIKINDLGRNFVLMQYTGLKDKNGVEIFEGDIVTKDGKVNAEVIFYELGFCLKLKVPYVHNSLAGYGFAGENKVKEMTATLDSECKVVGNRYQNPELLK